MQSIRFSPFNLVGAHLVLRAKDKKLSVKGLLVEFKSKRQNFSTQYSRVVPHHSTD
jgi:hypothetical protein